MGAIIKGRGAADNREGRFERYRVEPAEEAADDRGGAGGPRTEVRAERSRRIISGNDSPDLPFSRSINPYRGCEHGCIYCFARPTHAYLNLSPGLDFETRLYYKQNAAELLERELSRPGYRPQAIQLGANTDPYQPIERGIGLTRSLLEVLLRFRHPVTIVTKSHLILRDLDLLGELAKLRLCRVMVSVTTLDEALKRGLEPRTPSPRARLQAIEALARRGVPVGVLAAPMIPAVNDHELEAILKAAASAGARSAGYVLLRLPHEVAPLFERWLHDHLPLRAAHVLSRIAAMREGRLNDARFGSRMAGRGVEARLLAQRFALACRRFGLAAGERVQLEVGAFRVPADRDPQLGLDFETG
ncbi:MAG: PA0069 family radical SAM protein [Gammaproteobacteria bacterium]|nr:PA0069 family radical SAM protein [Gammaproteobacteria bacterium]